MKILSFIRYFFYLGLNWNWRIACYIIVEEIKGEKKFGINTTGSDELKEKAKQGLDISHATVYMPITYFQLNEIFATIPLSNRQHFMDIGCGKGRALCIAAYHGYKKVSGVDFSKDFCDASVENLEITKKAFPSLDYSVINKDAATVEIPTDVDCIFFFNPFDIVIMKEVLKQVMTSLQHAPRTLYIAYANPLYKQLFLDSNFKEIHYSKRLNYLELSILKVPAQ